MKTEPPVPSPSVFMIPLLMDLLSDVMRMVGEDADVDVSRCSVSISSACSHIADCRTAIGTPVIVDTCAPYPGITELVALQQEESCV